VTNPDAMIVFGTNVQHKELAATTAKALAATPRLALALTGGTPQYTDSASNTGHGILAESDVLYAELAARMDLGLYPVFIDRLSRNTLENVMCVADFVRHQGASVVTFLSHSYAVGRSAMTIRAVLPGLAVGGSAGLSLLVDGQRLTANTWHGNKAMRDIVWGEFIRVVTYARRGDIDPGNTRVEIECLANQIGLSAADPKS
jgi:DUF218 domain